MDKRMWITQDDMDGIMELWAGSSPPQWDEELEAWMSRDSDILCEVIRKVANFNMPKNWYGPSAIVEVKLVKVEA